MGTGESIRTGVLGEGRLDRALAEALPDLSRERIKALMAEGHLTVAGRAVTDASSKKCAGQSFALTIPAPRALNTAAEAIPLDVVYEDDALIVINKPPGLVVHPAAGHSGGTLVNALLHHCAGQLSGIGGVERPGIVHRIDAGTSGLLVVAKQDAAHEGLARQFADHSIERRYIALIKGVPAPPQGRIEARVGRSTQDRKKMAVVSGERGKHAVTHYRTLRQGRDVALIECQLETGRTHQVRVHMAHIGHPLIGDPVYGRRRAQRKIGPIESDFNRQALHAAILGFIHPISGEKMSFERPLPNDMQELLSELFV